MKQHFLKYAILIELLCIIFFIIIFFSFSSIKKSISTINTDESSSSSNTDTTQEETKNFIKWVDFNLTCEIMKKAYQYDIETHNTDTPINWISLLAYLGAKYGGSFSNYKESDMDTAAEQLINKEVTPKEWKEELKYYQYYEEIYTAVLGEFVGVYRVLENSSQSETKTSPRNSEEFVEKYGLKAFLPIAKNFPYSDYDDFGVSRSYGYQRRHLGHDMMGQIGTPIIAVESGYVEAIGWNQYGGWRLGIRSFDKKRYYYYAHLRQNIPYASGLEEGSIVTAGDVIGYLGRTGYSKNENVNNIDTPHLHFGIQLIFDESQKEGPSEIWIDCYEIARFLYQNRSEVIREDSTKEWHRVQQLEDPAVLEYQKQTNN